MVAGLDHDIKGTVRQCNACQQQSQDPAPMPLHPWSWPTQPWKRLHLDFAGPFQNTMFLVVLDVHMKWLEIVPLKAATATSTIQYLCELFASFGIPVTLVTDNGMQFKSSEFSQFCSCNGIHHVKTAPYHPSSNRLAERAVRIFNKCYKSSTMEQFQTITRFLFQYRNIPHTTTGISTAKLLLGRKFRNRLDSIPLDLSQ